jgi:hypothetical protein
VVVVDEKKGKEVKLHLGGDDIETTHKITLRGYTKVILLQI